MQHKDRDTEIVLKAFRKDEDLHCVRSEASRVAGGRRWGQVPGHAPGKGCDTSPSHNHETVTVQLYLDAAFAVRYDFPEYRARMLLLHI